MPAAPSSRRLRVHRLQPSAAPLQSVFWKRNRLRRFARSRHRITAGTQVRGNWFRPGWRGHGACDRLQRGPEGSDLERWPLFDVEADVDDDRVCFAEGRLVSNRFEVADLSGNTRRTLRFAIRGREREAPGI